MPGQSKLHSVIEATTNICVGFSVNYLASLCIFPLFHMHISLVDNFYMGLIYTVISLVRQYILRRYFNAWMVKLSIRKA